MASPTVLQFESHPDRKLHVWFFTDVTNSKEIADSILNRKLPRDYSFINATYVPDVFILHLCASKALFAETSKSLRSKKLHGELIVNLSGSKHIAASLKKYGATDDVQHYLVAAFDVSESEAEFVTSFVKGTPQPVSELEKFCNRQLIMKSFKLSALEMGIGSLTDAVACRVAAHDLEKV